MGNLDASRRSHRKPRRPSRIAEARKERLKKAAIEAIAEQGYGAITVASICEKAGYSRGLIGHYFKGKDDLLLAAIQYITAGFAETTQRAVRSAGDDALDRLHAVVKASFSPPNFTRENVSVWATLVGVGHWSPQLGAVYRDLWSDYRIGIARLMKRAATDRGMVISEELTALTFSQLIEGFTVGWATDPTQFKPKDAEAAVIHYLDLLFGPCSAQHPVPSRKRAPKPPGAERKPASNRRPRSA